MDWLNECTSIEETDGRHRAVIGIKPRAYLRDGTYRAMQFRLGDTGDPVLPHGLDELLAIRFADKLAGQSPIVHVGRGQSHIRMTAIGTRNNVPGSVVLDATGLPIGRRYNGAWTGADLEYLSGGHYLRKNVYLHAGHPSVFEFRIDGLAGVLSPSARGWDLLDDAGRPVLWAGAGFLYRPDSATSLTVPVPTTVRVQGGKSIYRYELPVGDWAGWCLEPTWTSQPDGTAGKDSLLHSINTATNYGTLDQFGSGENNTSVLTWRSLIQFSLADIPASAQYQTATLALVITLDRCTNTRNHDVFRVRRAWTEAGSTWNTYDGTNNWGTAGCDNTTSDRESTVLGTASIATGTAVGTTVQWALTPALVEQWRSGAFTNNGMVLRARTETDDGWNYASSNYATAANRPSLAVVYSLLSSGSIGRGRNFLARGGRARWP